MRRSACRNLLGNEDILPLWCNRTAETRHDKLRRAFPRRCNAGSGYLLVCAVSLRHAARGDRRY